MTTDARADRVPDRGVSAALAGSAAASASSAAGTDDGPDDLGWRWVVGTDALELHAAEPDDPHWRATCLSAGGALHRARVALAAEGLGTQVTTLPDGPDGAYLAKLVATGSIAVTPEARELYDATEPPPAPPPSTSAPTSAPSTAVPDQPTVPKARRSGERRAITRELVGQARVEGVRLRLAADGPDLVGLLHGPDTREAWLRAGAALSAVRLTARRRGLHTTATTADEATRRSRRRLGDREGWLGVGVGTSYVRLRLAPSPS